MEKPQPHPSRAMRMRVTIQSELANALLMPVLSPVLRITETFGVPLVVTMDYATFGKFMAAMADVDSGQKIGALSIEEVNLLKEPRRFMIRHGLTYPEES